MYLNYAILTIILLFLIYVSYFINDKGVIYFILILLIFIGLKKCVDYKKKNILNENVLNKNILNENFYNVNTARDALRDSVTTTNEIDKLKDDVKNVNKNLQDLTNVMKKQTINRAMERGEEASNFSLTESQKKQDLELDSLEKELDVLLKLYRKETENIDKLKYNKLPVFSSCKVKQEGELYKRDDNPLSTEDMIKKIENQEMLKNMGIESESSMELLHNMQNGNMGDNMDINLNLV